MEDHPFILGFGLFSGQSVSWREGRHFHFHRHVLLCIIIANLRVFHVTSPRNKALLSGIIKFIKHHCPKKIRSKEQNTTLRFFP